MKYFIYLMIFAGLTIFGLSGCEDAGDEAEDAAEEMADEMEDAAEEME